MKERRQHKNTNALEYRRLNNDLRRARLRAKKKVPEINVLWNYSAASASQICSDVTEYMEWNKNKGIRTFIIEDLKGQFITK